MTYEFNNKKIRIPDNEIENLVKGLNISKDEALQIWLEDEGYLDNEEQNTLDKKAKDSKITATVHKAKSGTKTPRKPRERKPDVEKENLIKNLANFLENCAENVKITNISKLIEFDLGENHYKLDLIKQRNSKK
jgi:hypothetical protein